MSERGQTGEGPIACELCEGGAGGASGAGGQSPPLVVDAFCHVVLVDEPRFPGYCRVIVNRHVREMSDLSPREQRGVMDRVFAVEAALRELLQPHKMNLASLGNVTPHLHWHVIPRWKEDDRFPQPIWGEPLRKGAPPPPPEGFAAALRERLSS